MHYGERLEVLARLLILAKHAPSQCREEALEPAVVARFAAAHR
jgi:hypothetical protein